MLSTRPSNASEASPWVSRWIAGPSRAQRLGQRFHCCGLQEGLAPRQAHEAVGLGVEGPGRGDDLVDGQRVRSRRPLAGAPSGLDPTLGGGLPGMRRVAPAATEITASEAHEEGGGAHVRPLALDR